MKSRKETDIHLRASMESQITLQTYGLIQCPCITKLAVWVHLGLIIKNLAIIKVLVAEGVLFA